MHWWSSQPLSLVSGSQKIFPTVTLETLSFGGMWATVQYDCVLCLRLTPAGCPPVQDINKHRAWGLWLIPFEAGGKLGCRMLWSGGPGVRLPGHRERSSRLPHAGLWREDPRLITLPEVVSWSPSLKDSVTCSWLLHAHGPCNVIYAAKFSPSPRLPLLHIILFY